MANAIDWDSVSDGSSTKKKGKNNFMKLGSGTYQIRPLGNPVEFHKFMLQGTDGKWRSAVCLDPDTNPVSRKHNIKPTSRYAVVVLDRADGEVKLLEAGVSVFKEFRAFFKHTGKNPGGRTGADFRIVIEGAGRTKKYLTSFVRNTPLTDEEVAMLQDMKKQGTYPDLEKVYEATPDDKIEERLFGEAVSSGGSTPARQAERPVVDDVPNDDIPSDEDVSGDDLPF